jgi:hypothetical protein
LVAALVEVEEGVAVADPGVLVTAVALEEIMVALALAAVAQVALALAAVALVALALAVVALAAEALAAEAPHPNLPTKATTTEMPQGPETRRRLVF